MSVTRELVQSVRRRVAESPGLLTAQLALELNASEAEVITALPLPMRKRARVSDFTSIWNCMAGWKNVVVHPSAAVSGTLARVRVEADVMPGPGLSFGALCNGESRLHTQRIVPDEGRFIEAMGSIWFVSLPLFNGESHSVRFFDKNGGHLLSIFLGRDHAGACDPLAKEEFDAMRERFGVTPVPRMHCRGCGSCTCCGTKHAH